MGSRPTLAGDPGSDYPVQEWLAQQYAHAPKPGSLVAIVRTRQWVRSFSCRPRKHPRAKGDPQSGRCPLETAHHHLTVAKHNIHVFSFFVFDKDRGRASIGLSSYLPCEVTLQLNGHERLARQMAERRWMFAMMEGAVGRVSDREKLRRLVEKTDYEAEIPAFGGRWLKRLPHGLTQEQLHGLGGYHWTIQVLECSLNYVFRDVASCQPVFEQLLRHNLLLGSPDSLRTLFERKREPRRSSNKLTLAAALRCLKASTTTAVVGLAV